MKLTESQMEILKRMEAGGTLTISKRMGDYGKYTLTHLGQRVKVNRATADALARSRRITVDQVGNLEVTYKLN